MSDGSEGGGMAVNPGGDGRRQLQWYLTGHGAWFFSLGLQFVLFPWLVTIILHMPAYLVGIALTSLMVPALIFMPLGGLAADRLDCRTLLLWIHGLASLPPMLLAAATGLGWLSYEVLIAYALTMGTLNAFAMPARDSLLSRVTGPEVQRAVMLTMMFQFSTQLIGLLCAAQADRTGAPALLALQAAVMLAGGIAVWRLAPAPPMNGSEETAGSRLHDLLSGVREVWTSPVILPVVVAQIGVGLFYVGSFNVVVPLMVRDHYAGGAYEIGLVNFSFWGGMILATLGLFRAGPIVHRGRPMLVALFSGTVILALMSIKGPFAVLCLLSGLWGVGAGVTMTMSRTIVQEAAPPSHRARVLSIYQMGFAGGAPIGSLLMGFLAGALGPHGSVYFPAGAMALVVAGLLVRTQTWHMRAASAPAQKPQA